MDTTLSYRYLICIPENGYKVYGDVASGPLAPNIVNVDHLQPSWKGKVIVQYPDGKVSVFNNEQELPVADKEWLARSRQSEEILLKDAAKLNATPGHVNPGRRPMSALEAESQQVRALFSKLEAEHLIGNGPARVRIQDEILYVNDVKQPETIQSAYHSMVRQLKGKRMERDEKNNINIY
ncbi:hypothetical protein [Chitinophaga vietnamensis]|uniref:hypothetical protein n=1 Tax=Chitinophaga vietnamensis TaxID=2593957 RepID=UPI001177D1DC|nr:hypothetical protein [Chitinophaga vietnamensis]